MAAGAGGTGTESSCDEYELGKMRESGGNDGGTMGTYLMSQSYTLKNG